MNDPSPIGKRATRAILGHVASSIEAELPIVMTELIMETFDQQGGARMYRITHLANNNERPVYVVVTAETLDENGARRLMPPHGEGVSEMDVVPPPVASRFTGINFQGPTPKAPGQFGSWGPEGRPPSPDQLNS